MSARFALVKETDPILSTPAEEWDFPHEDAHALALIVLGMGAVMTEHSGVGLAAPQVGIGKRLFILNTDGAFRACFNPRVLAYGGERQTRKEGCLSFPGLFLDVERHTELTVEYQDPLGQPVQEQLAGLSARCYQHEMDHLDGVCIVNYASKLALNIAQRKRNKVLKRKSK